MQTDNPASGRQAVAPPTVLFGAEAFDRADGTVLRWLGMAGFLINSRGTILTGGRRGCWPPVTTSATPSASTTWW